MVGEVERNLISLLKFLSFFFCYRVPPFLAQDPPVLLHPERVVPLSQSEQFERSYQPNVALAPPIKTSSDGITYSKVSVYANRVVFMNIFSTQNYGLIMRNADMHAF